MIEILLFQGAWGTHSVKYLTLDLRSGLDFKVVSSSPVAIHAGVGVYLKKKERKRNITLS